MAVTFKRPTASGTMQDQINALLQWATAVTGEIERKLSSIEEADLSESFRQKMKDKNEDTDKKLLEMSEEIERLSAQLNELKGE